MDPVFAHCKQGISEHQHGFMPKRSTTTNLLEFTSRVIDSFTCGSQTDAIYTDLSAAFDRINHRIAVAKLDRLGFHGSLLQWFSSYLSGRTATVTIGDQQSRRIDAPSGIPQGSHLGPLIFLLYFNDVARVLDGPMLAYADDLKLFFRINCLRDVSFLQSQLNIFGSWCVLNCLDLNVSKCSIITFTRKQKPIINDYFLNDQLIPRVDQVKDLGVILDPELRFKCHTNYVVEKASRTLGFIFRTTKNFTDIYCLKTLYCSLVRSTLEYASAVWSPFYNNGISRLEAVQRRFIRFALRCLPWNDPWQLPSYESRCMLINLETLVTRRNISKAMTIADLLSARLDSPGLLSRTHLYVRPRLLRSSNLLHVPRQRTNYASEGALNGLLRQFNRLAVAFDFDVSRSTLRQRFKVLCAQLG